MLFSPRPTDPHLHVVAGWEPVNTFTSGYLKGQEESSPASICPQVESTVRERFRVLLPMGDKETVKTHPIHDHEIDPTIGG
jgi:hypothetical protein